MGRKPVKDRALPSDYPQMAFRISRNEKEKLMKQIEEVQTYLNKQRGEGDPFVNKNDVILQCLTIGLKSIRK